jgi:ATP-binding cassette, subfamily B, bacterial PglK
MTAGVDRYLSLIRPGTRRRWVGVVLLAVLVSGIEAVGAVLVYGLVSLTTDPGASIELPAIGDIRRWLPALPQDQLIAVIAITVGLFFIARAAVVLGQRYFEERTTQLTGVDLSARLLQRYLRLPYSFHLQRNSSELIRNTNDSVGEVLGSILAPGVRILSDGMVALTLIILLLATAPLATGLAFLLIGPVVLITMRVVQPRLKRQGLISQRAAARSYQALQQSLHGYRDITVLGRQEYFLEVYRSARLTIAGTRYRRAVLSSFPRVSIEAAVIVFIAAFITAATALGDGAQRSLPILGLFAYAALRIMPAINSIVGSLNAMRFGRAALDHVQTDLAAPLPPALGSAERLAFRTELRLEQVSFKYDGTDAPTLRDIDLVIPRGTSVGIVGATGAGKSTLVDLIVGLVAPTTGRVTIDEEDLTGREAAWQRNIGLVSQQVFLLDDTLRANIALGVEASEVDEDRVQEAVHLAQLQEFVASLPSGLDTMVGERGVRVSGGQRQRVAIARALYPQPSVLVFDEGTAALDNLTEAALIDALARLRRTHTIITVAHRLSTVQDYDRIVFMRDGRIEGVGRFEELGARNEHFRRLARWTSAVPASQPSGID